MSVLVASSACVICAPQRWASSHRQDHRDPCRRCAPEQGPRRGMVFLSGTLSRTGRPASPRGRGAGRAAPSARASRSAAGGRAPSGAPTPAQVGLHGVDRQAELGGDLRVRRGHRAAVAQRPAQGGHHRPLRGGERVARAAAARRRACAARRARRERRRSSTVPPTRMLSRSCSTLRPVIRTPPPTCRCATARRPRRSTARRCTRAARAPVTPAGRRPARRRRTAPARR